MQAYSYCGLPVISNIAIGELPPISGTKTGLLFVLGEEQKQISGSAQWHSLGGGGVVLFCKHDSYHVLRFPHWADFWISADAAEIICHPMLGVSRETILHLLLDQVLPRCLAHMGRIMVHASAVRLNEGLILFLGDSGAGKSTLAGGFHKAGLSAISDDCLWIEDTGTCLNALPTYGGLRLWEDSLDELFSATANISSMAHYSSKRRVSFEWGKVLNQESSMPIQALVLLTPSSRHTSDIFLERLSLRETFIALLKQSFQLDILNVKWAEQHMRAIGRIVPQLTAYSLLLPHDYALLPLVRQKILEAALQEP